MNGAKRSGSKILVGIVVLILLLAVIKEPVASGDATQNVWQWINSAAGNVGQFLQSVFS